jgi:hypothetical protein
MENFKNGGISIPAGQLYTLTYLIGKSSFTATDVNYAVYVLPADELFPGTGTQIPVFWIHFLIMRRLFKKQLTVGLCRAGYQAVLPDQTE